MANQSATQTIYALFQTVADAERALGALQDHGIAAADIGIAARRPAEQMEAKRIRSGFTRVTDSEAVRQGEPEVSYKAQPGTLPPAALASTVVPNTSVDTSENVETVGKEGLTTTTPQDAAAGAAVGSGVGLVAGLLAAAAALTIPGVGLVLGGGALAAALGATAATTAAGAAVGGVTGYLRDMGMPEEAATSIHDRLTEGDYLVTIAVDPLRYDQIKQLLLKYNAAGVDLNASDMDVQKADLKGNHPAIVKPISSETRRQALEEESEIEELARGTEAETRDAIT